MGDKMSILFNILQKITIQSVIDVLTLLTLIVTAIFAIMYWKETQKMKNEMINNL